MAMFWEFFTFELKFRAQEHLDLRLLLLWFCLELSCIASESFGPSGQRQVLLNGPYANTYNTSISASSASSSSPPSSARRSCATSSATPSRSSSPSPSPSSPTSAAAGPALQQTCSSGIELIWCSVGLVAFSAVFVFFPMSAEALTARRSRKQKAEAQESTAPPAPRFHNSAAGRLHQLRLRQQFAAVHFPHTHLLAQYLP
jgi:hypothetical protein